MQSRLHGRRMLPVSGSHVPRSNVPTLTLLRNPGLNTMRPRAHVCHPKALHAPLTQSSHTQIARSARVELDGSAPPFTHMDTEQHMERSDHSSADTDSDTDTDTDTDTDPGNYTETDTNTETLISQSHTDATCTHKSLAGGREQYAHSTASRRPASHTPHQGESTRRSGLSPKIPHIPTLE